MAFEIEKVERNIKTRERVSIRLTLTGTISLSKNVVNLLELKVDDRMAFVWNSSESTYFIGKSADGEVLRKTTGHGLIFNHKALVNKIALKMDLALASDKLSAVSLDVNKEPVEWQGMKLFKLY